jgi:hypothetical protein
MPWLKRLQDVWDHLERPINGRRIVKRQEEVVGLLLGVEGVGCG